MTYQNKLNLVQEVLEEYPDLTLSDVGDIVYELTSDCYIRKPVDIKTFITDPYYLGNSVGSMLFPFWFKIFEDLYPHPCLNMNNEVILSVAIGSGKTTISIISMLYEMYKLLCLKNPYEYYGIANNIDKFAFSILTPTLSQGSSVAFSKFLGMINTSPFFKDIKATPKSKSSVSEEGVVISDFMVVHTGSSMNHLIGKLNYFGVMDEVSFFQGKDAIAKARELHIGFITRRKSRFIHLEPFTPGILWLTSSPLDEQDYLNEAIEKIKCNDFGVYYDNVPIWKVKGTRGNYLGDTFKIYLGDDKTDPYIIEDENKITEFMKSNILDIPMEHFREFNDDIIRGIRDVAGRRVQADTSLFKSKQQLTNLFINPNRFISDVVSMSFLDPDDKLEKYTTSLDYFKRPLNPNSYRFIHLDIATKKDKFGLASVYSTLEEVSVSKPTPENPNLPKLTKKERMFYVDFAVAIEAKKGEEINIFKVIDFLFHIKKLGYPIKVITSDIFQGDVTRQFLRLNGTKTEYLSVDRTKEPYYILRELINTSRIIGVRNQFLIKELIGLRDLTKKIDHLANNCFTGDTRIKLLDGTTKSFDELASLGRDNEFWVYSCLPDGTIVPALASDARKTKDVSEIAHVHLDNGKIIKCTPDHRFMLRDGSYLEASNLSKGTSLMPLYTKEIVNIFKSGATSTYEKVKSNKTGRYSWTHRMVVKENGTILDKELVVHHKDFNTRNNTPENLEVMTKEDHSRRHAMLNELGRKNIDKRIRNFKKNYWNNPVNIQRKIEKERLKNYRASEQHKIDILKIRSENDNIKNGCKLAGKKLNEIFWKSKEGKELKNKIWSYQKEDFKRGHLEHFDNLAIERLGKYKDFLLSPQHAIHVAGGYVHAWNRRLEGVDFKVNAERLRGMSLENILSITGLTIKRLKRYLRDLDKLSILQEYNHKVVKVEIITLEESVAVYDITVPSTSNFALADGVIVHNSKDLSDAVTGATFSCVNSKEYLNNYNVYDEITKNTDSPEMYNSQLSQMMKDAQRKQKQEDINKFWKL